MFLKINTYYLNGSSVFMQVSLLQKESLLMRNLVYESFEIRCQKK
jgi:hypothetical protein